MAYVVARPKGRFEIRESVHTPKGPRARSLANFAVLTEDVLERAKGRATRPFDVDSVRNAVRKVATARRSSEDRADLASGRTATVPRHEQPENRRFVAAARRMAKSLERLPEKADRRDPGDAFIDLIGVVAAIGAFEPTRPRGQLRFPPLALLRAARKDADQVI